MFLKLLIQTCSLGGCRIQAATSGILSVLPNICRESAMTLYTRRTYHQVTLHDEEIEEHFVKGWGKGGQKVNKTSNCVELCHKPTGTRVKVCLPQRSAIIKVRHSLIDSLREFYREYAWTRSYSYPRSNSNDMPDTRSIDCTHLTSTLPEANETTFTPAQDTLPITVILLNRKHPKCHNPHPSLPP